jgi:hypothetical protein
MARRAAIPSETLNAASAGRKTKLAREASTVVINAATFDAVEAAPSLNTGGADLAMNRLG